MSLDFLYPAAGNHAVQSMAFALEWQGELSEAALHKIYALAPQLKSNFQTCNLQKLVTVNLDQANAGTHVMNADAIGGVLFQRNGKFGQVASQLVVSRQNFIVTINDYTRWKPVLEAVMRFYKIILPIVLAEKSINAIALQYVDLFTWKDEPSKLDLKEVFRPGCKYIASNALEQKALWHCHHGFIVDSGDAVTYSRLDNVNVDIIDVQGDRGIQILTSHRASLKSMLRGATKDYLQTIEAMQSELHSVNKRLLQELLADEVCHKIKLVEQ